MITFLILFCIIYSQGLQKEFEALGCFKKPASPVTLCLQDKDDTTCKYSIDKITNKAMFSCLPTEDSDKLPSVVNRAAVFAAAAAGAARVAGAARAAPAAAKMLIGSASSRGDVPDNDNDLLAEIQAEAGLLNL